MKKVLLLAATAILATTVACGPSKEEMERKEKERRDSIAADSTRKADEARQAWMKDSTDKANMEAENTKRMADSLHQDSVKRFPKLFKEKK